MTTKVYETRSFSSYINLTHFPLIFQWESADKRFSPVMNNWKMYADDKRQERRKERKTFSGWAEHKIKGNLLHERVRRRKKVEIKNLEFAAWSHHTQAKVYGPSIAFFEVDKPGNERTNFYPRKFDQRTKSLIRLGLSKSRQATSHSTLLRKWSRNYVIVLLGE